MRPYLISAAFWVVMSFVAVLMGAARESFLRPRLGDLKAHQVETLLFCAVIYSLIYLFIHWLRPTVTQAWIIGVMWAVSTIGFDFGMGRSLMRKPWSELLADYDLLRGHLWPLVPLTLLIAPYLTSRLD